tara:strand:- start:666 stop:1484 length:819 start_codon:yes stop_codon:yes gene_type:complete
MMVEYLLLDYNRPLEAEHLLTSIRDNSEFDYSVSYLSNGGEQDYVRDFESKGLIDNLILNSRNTGCGAGTIQLFSQCQSKYALYIQVDHVLNFKIDTKTVEQWGKLLETGEYHCVDLAGDQGKPRGGYSERAQFIETSFYNSIPKAIGGPGPWSNMPWTEANVSDFFNTNNLKIAHVFCEGRPIFGDTGKWSMRSNPDGSVWRQKSDTKQVWMIKPPTEKWGFPAFTDTEWEEIIKTQSWPDGKLPFIHTPEGGEDAHSFNVPDAYWAIKDL